MLHKWNTAICSTLICFAMARAADGDTTKIYHAADVVVTATRTEILPDDASSPIQIISSDLIENLDGTTVADVLRNVNGVGTKDYGATGGVKNITFRGLSTENVLILLNGNPMNNAQYGSLDLSLLPLEAIDRMEISYGSSSALYGGNAVGGVVNIISRRASDDIHAHVKGEVGSFRAERFSADVQGRIAGLGMFLGITNESGNDNFPFIRHKLNAPETIEYRSNADYHRTSAYWNGDCRLGMDVRLNSSIQLVKFERGAPGSIDFPSKARQNDEAFHSTMDATILIKEKILWTIGGIYDQSDELFHDSLKYTYFNKNVSVHSQVEWSPRDWDRLLGGIEYSRVRLSAHGFIFLYDTLWNPIALPFTMNPMRIQKSAYVSNEFKIQNDEKWFDRFLFYQTARYDYYSSVAQDAFSPKVGANVRVYRPFDIRIRGSWGKNFRMPTFNDLYYPNYSNAGLIPEHSVAFDMGIRGALEQSGGQTLEITYFDITTTDKIAYSTNYIPYNIGKTENSGIEIQYDYHPIDKNFEANIGFSFVDAIKKNKSSATDPTFEKQFQNVPKVSGILSISCETDLGRINIHQSVVGLRYTNAENSASLPAYLLMDLNIIKIIPFSTHQVTFLCGVNNVFDTDYQVVAGYPMPGRSYKLGVSVEY